MRPRVVKERNEEGETVGMYNAAEGENESEGVRTVEWRTKLKRQKVKRRRELQKGEVVKKAVREKACCLKCWLHMCQINS